MSGTAITAPPEDLIFLMLYAPDGKTSVGVRNAIIQLLKLDDAAPALMRQAQWMTRRAEELLRAEGEEVTQKATYRYVADHYMYILADWQERGVGETAE